MSGAHFAAAGARGAVKVAAIRTVSTAMIQDLFPVSLE